MPNAMYDQVLDLMAEGKLNWRANDIIAVLTQNATFDITDKLLSDVGGPIKNAPIQGRWIAPGAKLMGLPAVFQGVQPGTYQVIVCQNLNRGNPSVLAFYDTNDGGDPLTLVNQGSFILRPAAHPNPPAQTPTDSRLWIDVMGM